MGGGETRTDAAGAATGYRISTTVAVKQADTRRIFRILLIMNPAFRSRLEKLMEGTGRTCYASPPRRMIG